MSNNPWLSISMHNLSIYLSTSHVLIHKLTQLHSLIFIMFVLVPHSPLALHRSNIAEESSGSSSRTCWWGH